MTLDPEARAMAIATLNDMIAEIETSARDLEAARPFRIDWAPAMDDYGEDNRYERLITLAKRARCAMTVLGFER